MSSNKIKSREKFLDLVDATINGSREKDYGDASVNFSNIAKFWETWLSIRGKDVPGVTADDVAPMMILVKLARLTNALDHRDSWLDIAGYAALGAEVSGESVAAAFAAPLPKERDIPESFAAHNEDIKNLYQHDPTGLMPQQKIPQ